MLTFYALWIGLILTTAFALWKGGRSERIGAVWLFSLAVAGLANELSGARSPILDFVADGVYATGLLPGAIYFVSWWIGVQTVLAGIGFMLEAAYLMLDRPVDATFTHLGNVIFAASVINLFVASAASAWSRRRKVKGLNPLPAPEAETQNGAAAA